jgi:hypothetical protein
MSIFFPPHPLFAKMEKFIVWNIVIFLLLWQRAMLGKKGLKFPFWLFMFSILS